MSQAKFRKQISFNSNDWTKTRDKSGRTFLVADDKGVLYRTNKIVTYLSKEGEATATQLLAMLKKIHPSYTHADLVQPLKHLTEVDVLLVAGKGRAMTYSLTAGAAAAWKRATT